MTAALGLVAAIATYFMGRQSVLQGYMRLFAQARSRGTTIASGAVGPPDVSGGRMVRMSTFKPRKDSKDSEVGGGGGGAKKKAKLMRLISVLPASHSSWDDESDDEGGGQDEGVLMTPNPLQAFDGSARAEEGGGSAVDEEAGL